MLLLTYIYPKRGKSMENQVKNKQSVIQFIKFALFSCSAGIIQIGSFTLMNEVLLKTDFIQHLLAENSTAAKLMSNEYGPIYLIALTLSVLWNFTINRKFTFKSAANIPVAMFKVFLFYLVFTPISTILGNYFTKTYANFAAIEYIVLAVTMATNMITEFLYCKFVVYKNQENTATN